MRKVKLSIQTTINGYVDGLNGETDWMTWNPDAEFMQFIDSEYASTGTILLGRKAAEGYIDFWQTAFEKNPDTPFAGRIAAIPKIVFTRNLTESPWKNTTLAKGSPAEEIARLKQQDGKDILVVAGADFVSSLIKEGLIDEYHLIINPTAMATGKPIFNLLDSVQKFTPLQAKLYPGGKTVLSFVPKRD